MKVNSISANYNYSGTNNKNIVHFGKWQSMQKSIPNEITLPPVLSTKIRKLAKELEKNALIVADYTTNFKNLVCATVCPNKNTRYREHVQGLVPDKAEIFFAEINSDGEELVKSIREYEQKVKSRLQDAPLE